jgi:hypothetical protein
MIWLKRAGKLLAILSLSPPVFHAFYLLLWVVYTLVLVPAAVRTFNVCLRSGKKNQNRASKVHLLVGLPTALEVSLLP